MTLAYTREFNKTQKCFRLQDNIFLRTLHNLCLLLYLPSDTISHIIHLPHLSLVRFIMTPGWILSISKRLQRLQARKKFEIYGSLILFPSQISDAIKKLIFAELLRRKQLNVMWSFLLALLEKYDAICALNGKRESERVRECMKTESSLLKFTEINATNSVKKILLSRFGIG